MYVCVWCNGYCCRKWTWQPKFKSSIMKLFAFHIMSHTHPHTFISVCLSVSLCLYIYICVCVCDVMGIIVENGYGNPSSNPVLWSCLHFTSCLTHTHIHLSLSIYIYIHIYIYKCVHVCVCVCVWCNGYCCRKWTWQPKFKSSMRLLAFLHNASEQYESNTSPHPSYG